MFGFLFFPRGWPVGRCDGVDNLTQFRQTPTFVREHAQVFIISHEVI